MKLKNVTGVGESNVRDHQFNRLKELMQENLIHDGEANGDQDGVLCINGFIFDGMKRWYHDHNILAAVVKDLYEENPKYRDDILELVAVHTKPDIVWAKELIIRGLEESDPHTRFGALVAVELWDNPTPFPELLWHLAGEETEPWILEEYKSRFDIDRR